MKKKPVIPGEDSEENEFSVDEPEEVAPGTDEEWEPGSGEAAGRRTSRRLRNTTPSKKPRLAEPSSSEEEEEEEEDEEEEESDDSSDNKRKKSKGGRGRGRPAVKKKNGTSPAKSTAADNTVTSSTESTQLPTPTEKEFTSGAFVVLKTDFAGAGDPPIWKIDGKALLQKYVPFEQEGKTLYKNTSTYSGWSAVNKDLYYPAPIAFKLQNRKETIVEFLRDSVNKDATVETGKANDKPAATAPNAGAAEEEDEEEDEEEEDEEGAEGEEEDPAATEQ